MLVVIKIVSVQLIASLASDVKLLALSPLSLHINKLEGEVKKPMALFEKG